MNIIDILMAKVLSGGGGGGGDGSGGGVLMVTDTNRTLDKTMGEIQDAYLAGKRVIINTGMIARDVIGVAPVELGRTGYSGVVETYNYDSINQMLILKRYPVSGETEEAARNAYPVHSGS